MILPFEPKYFVKEGLATSYVGHPAIEDLEKKDNKLFREKYKIPKDDLLLCLAPGSRKQEIQTLLPIFLEAVYYLSKKITQKITIVIPSKSYLKSIITSYISASNLNVILIDDSEKQDIFSASDLALSKSGTITTELAFYKMPMVIAHRVNQISYWLLRKMIKVKYATIVNILADKELIPELLQEKCNPVTIGEELYKAFLPQNRNQWEKELQIQLDKLQVGKQIPSHLAAKEILALFN